MIQKVQSKVEDQFLFLGHDQKDLDGLLMINGCFRSCATENLNHVDAPYLSIARESDFETLIDFLMTLDKKRNF